MKHDRKTLLREIITFVFTKKIKAASQPTEQVSPSRSCTLLCGMLYLPKRIVIGPVIRAPVSPPIEKMETMTVQIRVTW